MSLKSSLSNIANFFLFYLSLKRRLKRETYVEKIIEVFPIYPFDLSAARTYERIWALLAKKGISIGSHDLMIASTCISLGFSVITSDIRDYGRIEGLTIEKCGV